jgi:hypothetical protein
MPERYERLVRIICLALGAVLVLRIGWVAIHYNPLAHLKIPAVPTLAAAAQASAGINTNNPSAANTAKTSTNTSHADQSSNSTNSTKSQHTADGTTNLVAKTGTNSPTSTTIVTNTNPVVAEVPPKAATNSIVPGAKPGSNELATPSAAGKVAANASPPNGPMSMVNPQQHPGMPAKPRELPPEIQARVDRVTDSEILGPVMRPLPMALLGIAGNVAFLRAANGQTGLVKEGEALGGLKLLRIGINRVLIEQEGQKKELMMFSGFGGDSLLPK